MFKLLCSTLKGVLIFVFLFRCTCVNNVIAARAVDEYTDAEKDPTTYAFERTSRQKGARLMQGTFSSTLGRVTGGGKSVTQILFPYQVTLKSIAFDYKHFCGGSIYNEDTIISAAHCFFEDSKTQIPISDIQVVAGEHNLEEHGTVEQNRTVISVVFFNNYRLYPGYNDIAILKLSSPLTFSMNVFSIRIADANEEPTGKARVSGWGYTLVADIHDSQHTYGYPKVLHFVDVEVVDKPTCIQRHQTYAVGHAKHPRIFCAGAPKGQSGMDSCQGDSGGPLACLDTKKYLYLCGIVQAGFGCGTQIPGFYTKVNQFIKFIHKHGGSQERNHLYNQLRRGIYGVVLDLLTANITDAENLK